MARRRAGAGRRHRARMLAARERADRLWAASTRSPTSCASSSCWPRSKGTTSRRGAAAGSARGHREVATVSRATTCEGATAMEDEPTGRCDDRRDIDARFRRCWQSIRRPSSWPASARGCRVSATRPGRRGSGWVAAAGAIVVVAAVVVGVVAAEPLSDGAGPLRSRRRSYPVPGRRRNGEPLPIARMRRWPVGRSTSAQVAGSRPRARENRDTSTRRSASR